VEYLNRWIFSADPEEEQLWERNLRLEISLRFLDFRNQK